MAQQVKINAILSESQRGKRLDKALSEVFPNYSRSCIKEWIFDSCVTVNGTITDNPKKKVLGNELIIIKANLKEEVSWKAQNIPLNIIYEDNDIIVINKPRGLVVHPGAGNFAGTVLNALLYHFPEIINVPRAGIIHRLDKDTTGLMVIAKTVPAQIHLINSLRQHKFIREYEAVTIGTMTAGGTVDKPIARHLTKRTRMAVSLMGKPAVTHYRIIERFRAHTHLRLRLETGRTHQIRVHMLYINHPLVGDPLYGSCPRFSKGISEECTSKLRNFDRQALHATMLRIYHPISRIEMEWHASLPKDMADLVNILKTDTKEFKNETN